MLRIYRSLWDYSTATDEEPSENEEATVADPQPSSLEESEENSDFIFSPRPPTTIRLQQIYHPTPPIEESGASRKPPLD